MRAGGLTRCLDLAERGISPSRYRSFAATLGAARVLAGRVDEAFPLDR
jgi:hypothetical protein